MVARARLEAKTLGVDPWPYHKAKWTVMSAQVLMRGDRRMEAESYLAQGYGIRLAIQSKHRGWQNLSSIARVWQPNRLKATIVSRKHGVPFLAATQVLDTRPISRKYLALSHTPGADQRYVKKGTILVTCSGSVGKSVMAYGPHLGTIISHDLLRVDPKAQPMWGWIYAYLKAPYTRAMMTSARYGHIIKHLETSHLDGLPIIDVDSKQLSVFQHDAQRCIDLREESFRLTIEAEALYEEALSYTANDREAGVQPSVNVIRSKSITSNGGRRLDASYHSGVANRLRDLIRQRAKDVVNLGDCGVDIWVPGRYKRIAATTGVVFMDSSDLFKVNPDPAKILQDCRFGDEHRGRVQPGWLLMASSGQTYGIVGGVVMATKAMAGKVVANHVIRIALRKSSKIDAGYLQVVLSHHMLGRPLVKSMAFGSSVPEIDPIALALFPVPRLEPKLESRIASLATKSAELSAEADLLEQGMTAKAQAIIEHFIHK